MKADAGPTLRTGLVSITFRRLALRDIVNLVARGGLQGIEWGGDVHVPHGNLPVARQAARMTEDAGLAVAAYGSYYRAGESEGEGLAFASVLDTARELKAPAIRVWAGKRSSEEADELYRARVEQDLRRVGAMAGQAGVVVACEYHAGTLTDTNESAQALIQATAHPNVKLYWQPPLGKPPAYCLDGLEAILPVLVNVHCFHWTVRGGTRDQRPLSEGAAVWKQYLKIAASTGREHWVMLEFVRDGAPEQFLEDAAILKKWVAAAAMANADCGMRNGKNPAARSGDARPDSRR